MLSTAVARGLLEPAAMGNRFGKSSGDSKFTKPTGLYPTCEWDDKTVKKLINKKKVAPRYPGREEPGPELDECPICFLVSKVAIGACLFYSSGRALWHSAVPRAIHHLHTTSQCARAHLLLCYHAQWYPGGLNRSKCCKQPICTGWFVACPCLMPEAPCAHARTPTQN